MSEERNPLADIKVDTANLYREESISDLKVATIRQLTPIKTDGSTDENRPVLFVAETTIMSERGPIPVNGPIEADNLEDAIAKFPEAVQAGVDRLMEQVREMQRQEMSRIVVPGQPGGGGGGGFPPGGGQPGGGGKIVL